MKKNGTMIRIAVLMLVLTLATACFVGGTFAKYTSSANYTGTVQVATWNVHIGTDADANAEGVQFSLTNTVDTDTGVAKDGVDGIMAPGTSGDFQFTITNESEVAAKYTVVFTLENCPTNLAFTSGTTGVTVNQETTDDGVTVTVTGELDHATDGTATTVGVVMEWTWAFGDNDTENAEDNANAGVDMTVNAVATFEQLDTYPTANN